VVAILAGVSILAMGWLWADAVGSIFISAIIIVGAWRLILESVNVLLEGTPPHINRTAVEHEILKTDGVSGVHDLHIWTISSGLHALSAHISHPDSVAHSELLGRVRQRLHDRFGIDHLTIQMESLNLETEAIYVCETGTRCFEPAEQVAHAHRAR
jgi:cobalt-zinc-cadmium efflux system protein